MKKPLASTKNYKNNILGVITDVRFPRVERGEKDGLAGIKLCAAIRKEDPFVPLIIQSSESDNVAYAAKYDAAFIDKNSKKAWMWTCAVLYQTISASATLSSATRTRWKRLPA